MQSKDRSRLMNMAKVPFKVVLRVPVLTSSKADYHYMPSIPCQLIDAKAMIKVAPSASKTVTISKETIAALDTPTDKLVSGATGVAVSDSELAKIVTGTTNNVSVNAVPGANYQTARQINGANREALKIAIPASSTNLDMELILEFMPV